MSDAPPTPRRELYREIEPFATHRLPVGAGHELYVEEVGNPAGIPAVALHGGPGAGLNPGMRRYFDPVRYRVVLFDQRGCGRSRPAGSVAQNTTWDLVADTEAIRRFLGIERWLVFGGSWGSTLALAYAERHPDRATALVLRGIFLGTHQEIAWFAEGGPAAFRPDAWQRFLEPIPLVERENPLLAYHRRLFGPDQEEAERCAIAWVGWESDCVALRPEPRTDPPEQAQQRLTIARIECHYFVNGCFFETPDQLSRHLEVIRHLPGVIVQGRYDLVCPPRAAWELARRWPEAELHLVDDAGHSGREPGLVDRLVLATDQLAERLEDR